MKQTKNANLDLRDINGEGNLASALGVGSDAVGGLWKRLKLFIPEFRQICLDSIASDVSSYYFGWNLSEEVIADKLRVSSKLIHPLIAYQEIRGSRYIKTVPDRDIYHPSFELYHVFKSKSYVQKPQNI